MSYHVCEIYPYLFPTHTEQEKGKNDFNTNSIM